ncbi:class I SAM-dependent methyltransferase [Brumimicrobium aurantiacum]|uniref:Uncharacterized protein n=1 Tax=Brumimicrobium aurantiacum TaxID=1737063 RepID=A0A3E1F2H5_9FLAO|nr:class I SAM-dependent methyltransferase [Brumimicrobium aurantiacum]RFC55959.1 hypothetical protein DXU93_03205 [Brumimicrobium aurantiacum]
MKTIYQHTKAILLSLTVLNLAIHLAGFYYGTQLFNLFSTFVISELLLCIIYLIITVYKWINENFHNVETEQIKLSKEITRTNNSTIDRIEKLENDILLSKKATKESFTNFKDIMLNKIESEQMKLSSDITKTNNSTLERIEKLENKNLELINKLEFEILDRLKHTQEKNTTAILDAVNSLKEQANKNDIFNKKELIAIVEILGRIKKLSEHSIHEIAMNYELLKHITSEVDTKTHQLLFEFTKANTENNSLKLGIESTNQNIDKNKEEIRSLKTIFNKEIEKLNQSFIHQLNSKEDELSLIVDKIHNTIDLFKEKINSSTFDFHSLKQDIEQYRSDLELAIENHFSHHSQNQKNHFDYQIRKQLNIIYDRLDALISIHETIKPIAPLPIMHDWRVSSDFAHATLSTLLEIGKGSVIDIGSGISTILMGYGVKQNGNGKVISLEHSLEYYKKTKALIKFHQLEEYCELYYCPLIEYDINGDKWLWYDISKICFPSDISLVCVDGPPGITQYMARYPALPLLIKHLNNDTVLFLDDGDRDEEAKIASKWETSFKRKKIKHSSHKGYFTLKIIENE